MVCQHRNKGDNNYVLLKINYLKDLSTELKTHNNKNKQNLTTTKIKVKD